MADTYMTAYNSNNTALMRKKMENEFYDKPKITEEYLQGKAHELRYFLDEANKYNMAGSIYAKERLKDLSLLDSNPEWKETATQILTEYADMIQ